jgi:hypothetical protein
MLIFDVDSFCFKTRKCDENRTLLALIAAEILVVLSLKTTRLQRIAGKSS